MTIPSTKIVTDPSKVEQTLAGLYTSATEEAGPNTAPVIRAVLANLIVYACGEREAGEAANTIAGVAGSHPCRALIVQTDGSGSEEWASVSAVCGVTERNDRQLCGEIIGLRAPSGVDTTGLVLPLLMADVPVYLWAPCEAAFENESFVSLIREADHVIVDSRRFHDLESGLRSAMSVCQAAVRRCLVDDLGWYCLLRWREMIAQHFDPPVFRERLERLRRISIQFAAVPNASDPPATALLMAGWLIKRLGLDIGEVTSGSNGELHIDAAQNSGPVEINISPTESPAPAGSLVSVTIQAQDDGATATFVTKIESAGEVTASMECAGVCLPPQVLELPHTSDATLLHEALDSTARDETYYEALETAYDLVQRQLALPNHSIT